MTIGTGGYVLAVLALVIGFIAGTWAGAVSDWVRDWFYVLQRWAMTVLALAGIAAILAAVAHWRYGLF